jgi:metal-responsive CopG/Arc/MetJ family transcriptional regulator
MNNILGSISILSSNRHKNSLMLNQVLSDYSQVISARLGVNVQKKCTKNCLGLILLAVDGDDLKIKNLVKDLKKIKDLRLSLNILKK